MNKSIDAGCSEMVSNDVAVDGESVSIDPDIRRREWDPSLRILPISPTNGSGFDARCYLGNVESQQETIKQCYQAQAVWALVCSTRLWYRLSQKMLAVAAMDDHGAMAHGSWSHEVHRPMADYKS
jgi:hypothetical protein